MMDAVPSYRARLSPAELRHRADQLHEFLSPCVVCPRACGADRTHGAIGVCRTTDEVWISSASPHYGEEPPLVGFNGSGTIFFSSCNLKCQYCQNYEISQLRMGRPVSISRLAHIMLSLQALGCHNINLVTPTHVIPQIVSALVIAAQDGLSVPLVYNCGGYESVKTLRLLEDVVDIYMPDLKYSAEEAARRFSGARNYWEKAREAVKEMHRQVGNLRMNSHGIAERGLLIRHLVLPGGVAGTQDIMRFIAEEISVDSYVNVMDQYRPLHNAFRHPVLNNRLTASEYAHARNVAIQYGLHRGFPADQRERG